MKKIVVEDDHFLKILAVILDPSVPDKHRGAVCKFFAHDVPDFLGWCDELRSRYPGLYPAELVFVPDQGQLAAQIPDAAVAIVESLVIDRSILGAGHRLALVQKFGTITNNIDLTACAERNIPVAKLRRHVNIAVAEQAFSLAMALAKRLRPLAGLVEADALEAAGWHVRQRSPDAGYSNYSGITGLKMLFGATLGIVGLGEVGREVARRARAFEMKTVYFQRRRLAEQDELALGAAYAPLDDVIATSDFLIVQLPLNEPTRGLIGRDELAQIKKGAIFVNVARAELIDHDALVETLARGDLGGFALDVGYNEPADPSDPLLRFREGNVILMPHTAIGSRDNALHDLDRLCSNLWRAVTGRQVSNGGSTASFLPSLDFQDRAT